MSDDVEVQLFTVNGTPVEDAHVVSAKRSPYALLPEGGEQFSDVFVVKLTGYDLTLSDVEDACAECEHCNNETPQYCTNTRGAEAYYYKGVRVAGSPDDGFLLYSKTLQ